MKIKRTRIRDFAGLVTNVDSLDSKPEGMRRQKNLVCVKAGELTTRRGLRKVTWSN